MPINKELVAERTTYPEGHVVHLSLERVGADQPMVSLAACECGWQNIVPLANHTEQYAAVELHWQEADSSTGAPPPG